MKNQIDLHKELESLLMDEDLTDDKLQKASEGLLINLYDYLNGLSPEGVSLIIKERAEQIEKHGYAFGHDKAHSNGEIALVAGYIAIHNIWAIPDDWQPFKAKVARKGRIEQLQIAGALIAAEIDRLLNIEEKDA